jgi:hypothetical protein
VLLKLNHERILLFFDKDRSHHGMRLRFLLFLFFHHLFLSLLLIFDHKLLRQGLKDVGLVDLRYFREVAESMW